VWCVAWSPRGVLASSGADRSVRVWTRAPGDNAQEWLCIAQLSGETFLRAVRSVAWGVDGRTLAAACFDATATVLELIGGKEPRLEAAVSLEGHESEVKSLSYSSSGGLLASCSRDRSVWIWEVGVDFDYECISVLNGHSADVKSVRWHPEVEILVSCSYDNTIRVWVEDEDDWFCLEELTAHESTVWSVAFDKTGRHLVSVGDGGVLIVWQRKEPPLHAIGEHAKYTVVAHLDRVHDGAIYSVDWARTSNFIVTSGGDDAIRVHRRTDFAAEVHRGVTDNVSDPATAVLAKSEGLRDGTGSCGIDEAVEDKTASVVDSNVHVDRCCKDNLEVEESKNGGSGLRTKTDQVWQEHAVAHRAHTGDVNCVAWNPDDETMLASCGDDGLVRIWKLVPASDLETDGL
jgi:cytosolic iron-sulfur protein assembly protein CIAO1